MKGGVSLAIPCRADEPGLGATLESLYAACRQPGLSAGLIRELLVCINGVESAESSAPLVAVRAFCARHNVYLQELQVTAEAVAPVADANMAPATLSVSDDIPPRCVVLSTKRRGKPLAWNILWRQASGENVLFCDADVRIDHEAILFLSARLQSEPRLQLVAAREVPVLEGKGTIWGRMGALGYRFDFGNAGGRLFLIRKTAFSGAMPEDLLLEDAWLTVAVGRQRVAKEWQAKVYFLPPATGRDYFAERVRTEGGKLQIRRAHAHLLRHGPIATYPWSRFFGQITVREYPLAVLGLLVRGVAHIWARLALLHKGFYALYRPFRTTKQWAKS